MQAMKIQPEGRAPVILDACFDCGGLWFDRGELDRASKVKARREPTSYQGALSCPRCGVATFEEILGGERELAWACFKCKGVFVTGEGVDRMLKLHRTAAAGRAAEPAPPKPDWGDYVCKRCGVLVTQHYAEDARATRWRPDLCRSCADDVSVTGRSEVDDALLDGLAKWVGTLFD